MNFANTVRQHTAALRALLVLTLLLGIAYPLGIWLLAQLPGLKDKADGSLLELDGKPVGSSLIGQLYTDGDGAALPQYFQGRPSAAGDGYDPMSSGASNLGPESIIDSPGQPGLLTLVCSRSAQVGARDGVSGARPFCTDSGVGAVLSALGTRDVRGIVTDPTRVISVNELCPAAPFIANYEGVAVECAEPGADYASGQIVPIHGDVPVAAVPADAVTASGSGLDPHISPEYAALQVNRVAAARGLTRAQVQTLVAEHTDGRALGFMGAPRVNVLQLNLALDGLGG